MAEKDDSGGQIEFSELELTEMGAELAATSRLRPIVRIPVDEVPRPNGATPAAALADAADQIVEQAFTSGHTAEGRVTDVAGETAREVIEMDLTEDPEPTATVSLLPDEPPRAIAVAPAPVASSPARPRAMNPALAALARAVAAPPAANGQWLPSSRATAATGEVTPIAPAQTPTTPLAVPPARTQTGDEEMELDGVELEDLQEAPSDPALAGGAAPWSPTPRAPASPPAVAGGATAAAMPPMPAETTPEPSPAPLRPRRKRRAKQWFEEIFDDDYLRTLPSLSPRQTAKESQFIADSLGIASGGTLLDLACGYGRHALELAAKGFQVTGLDLSLPLLIRAADAARRASVNINFIHGDLREIAFENEFDGAYCVFSSFGYFDDDTNRKVAVNLARALKPGGKLLLEVVNRDYLCRDLPTRVWWQGEGCVVLEEVDFNYFSSRLQVQRSLVFEDGRQIEQEISIRAYSLHEIGKILHHSGFRVTEVSGGLSLRGKFFGANSRQLIVVAEKKLHP